MRSQSRSLRGTALRGLVGTLEAYGVASQGAVNQGRCGGPDDVMDPRSVAGVDHRSADRGARFETTERHSTSR